MKKGYGKTLEVEDMYNVCPEDKSQILGDKLERYLFIVCLFYKKNPCAFTMWSILLVETSQRQKDD